MQEELKWLPEDGKKIVFFEKGLKKVGKEKKNEWIRRLFRRINTN